MSLKLFLVEDNPHIRKSVTEFLEQDGAVEVVNWAPTEHGAVSWLQSNCLEWEVAVVDLFLQQGSGMGVLGSCKNRNAEQKVVVLTNYVGTTVAERCRALGADAVFEKTHEIEDLRDYLINSRRQGNQLQTVYSDRISAT